ncbi:MAG: hypothetical protein ACTIMJ_06575 [Weissella hellenica]|uniref:hypothetical protein n=1 Tax=Weissella hellenica TaxID=46256 RepID=UPI003F958817
MIYNSRFFESERQALIANIPGTMSYSLVTFHGIGDDISMDNIRLRLDWRAPDVFKAYLNQALSADENFDRIGYVTRTEMLLGQAMFDYNGNFTLAINTLTASIANYSHEAMQLEAVGADMILPVGLTDLRHVIHLTKWHHENHVLYHLVAGLPALEQKVDNLRNAGTFKNYGSLLRHETELDSQILLVFIGDLIQDYFGVESNQLRLTRAAFGKVDPNQSVASNRVLIADFEN